jgi:hypothetical protein
MLAPSRLAPHHIQFGRDRQFRRGTSVASTAWIIGFALIFVAVAGAGVATAWYRRARRPAGTPVASCATLLYVRADSGRYQTYSLLEAP